MADLRDGASASTTLPRGGHDGSGFVREADIFRGDRTVSRVMLRRNARLYTDRLEVYHLRDKASPELELVAYLKSCTVTAINEVETDVKPPGANLFVSLLSGSVQSQMLFTFTLTYLKARSKTGRKPKRKDAVLGFENEATAQEWAELLQQYGTRRRASLASLDEFSGVDGSGHSTAARRGLPAPLGGSPTATILAPRYGHAHASESPPDSVYSEPQAQPRVRLPSRVPLDPNTVWHCAFHWNGLVVYYEGAESEAYAASCSMHATPRVVFEHFIRLDNGDSAWDLFDDVEVLDPVPENDHKLVFKALLRQGSIVPNGPALTLPLPPREVVLEQTWEYNEEDGIFVINFCSVEHPRAPERRPAGFWDALTSWGRPVRAHVQHMGVTISPLRLDCWHSAGKPPVDSPESLITVVARAGLGGVFAVGWLAWPLRIFSSSWLNSLLLSIVQTRDNVEQLRYAAPPVTLLAKDSRQAATSAPSAASSAAPLDAHDVFTSASSLPRASIVRGISTSASMRSADSSGFASAYSGTAPLAAPAAAEAPAAPAAAAGAAADEESKPEPWLPARYYASPPGPEFKVRGANYLRDRKKVPSQEPAFQLAAVELCSTPGTVQHISQYLPAVMHSRAAFLMPMHFSLPYAGKNYHLVCVFALQGLPEALDSDEPFTAALAQYYAGTSAADDERRDRTLKMIPTVKEGAWVMRQAVGSTPFIIGTKLKSRYFRGPRYLETCIDIQSNATAARITSFVLGAITSLAIDLGFVLEGKTPEHLPEQLLGTVTLNHLDMREAHELDTAKPLQPRRPPPIDTSGNLPATPLAAAALGTPSPSLRRIISAEPSPVQARSAAVSGAGGAAATAANGAGASALTPATVRALRASGGGEQA